MTSFKNKLSLNEEERTLGNHLTGEEMNPGNGLDHLKKISFTFV